LPNVRVAPHNDRHRARQLNAEALALFQNAYYTEAAQAGDGLGAHWDTFMRGAASIAKPSG
jgi:hypothetical protein